MALPKLETPKHKCILPLSEREIKFRPFLVGEQKMLLIAQESENQNDQIDEMMRLIDICCDDVTAEDLTTLDLEYLFLQIRMKSIGETSDISLSCDSCKADNEYQVDLQKTEIVRDEEEISNIVKLTPTISMELEYPSYKMIQKVNFAEGQEDIKSSDMFVVIQQCVVSIIDNDEVHNRDDFNEKELVMFLDSMSVKMYSDMLLYFNSAPKLEIPINFECSACNKVNDIQLSGLSNFFV